MTWKSIGDVPEFNRLRFESESIRLGSFYAPRWHPRFHNSGPIPEAVMVFPRTWTSIQRRGQELLCCGANRVLFYNAGETYRRIDADAVGDRCDWFAFDSIVLGEVMKRFNPEGESRFVEAFPFSWGAVDRQTYFLQRRLVRYLQWDEVDRLWVEEAVLTLLTRVLVARFEKRPTFSSKGHRALAEAARETLTRRYREDFSLSELATTLHTSVYHLCRVFKKVNGQTLHRFRAELRLRHALHLLESHQDLTPIAFDLGYSSLSHFSNAFKAAYGLAPSEFRPRPRRDQITLSNL